MRPAVWLLLLGAACGCAHVDPIDAFGQRITARIDDCMRAISNERATVHVRVRGGRARFHGASGLTYYEERCVERSVPAEEVPRSIHTTARVTVRRVRTPEPHPARTFLLEHSRNVAACRPCERTRIVATPIGERYDLAAELGDDERELDPEPRACIQGALAEMPPPPRGDMREIVVRVPRDDAACAAARP